MTYRETVRYLNSLVNYERRSGYSYARSFKLERIRAFLLSIGDPQGSFKSIHVAGTKGKGSVCLFCAHILRRAGCRVGLYTSPHLIDPRERLRVLEPGVSPSGDFEGMITRERLSRLVSEMSPAIDSFNRSSAWGPLTFFEVYTSLAFRYFQARRVDCAVLETGLGGRLDATNVVEPVACAITSISLDHMDKLGPTLEAIAREKAGIIKRLPPGAGGVISVPQRAHVRAVLEGACRRHDEKLLLVGRDIIARAIRQAPLSQRFDLAGFPGERKAMEIRMLGTHQIVNAACGAALAVSASRSLGLSIGERQIRHGLADAFWPGRFEIIGETVLDGAHNGDSARALARALKERFSGKEIVVVMGVSRDKDLARICRALLSVSRRFIVTWARNPRAFAPEKIRDCLVRLAPAVSVTVTGSVAEALRLPLGGAAVRCVTGSIFVVGEARPLLAPRGKGVHHA